MSVAWVSARPTDLHLSFFHVVNTVASIASVSNLVWVSGFATQCMSGR